MSSLPDDSLVVRGGQNLPESFAKGSGIRIGPAGKMEGVSVNSAPGMAVEELTASKPETGYPGIPNRQIGVTTVGKIRALGGAVVRCPTRTNPYHATLSGLTPEQAAEIFRPTLRNPSRQERTLP